MITGADLVNINLSWLYHLTQSLENQVKYIFQTCDLRSPNDPDLMVTLDEFVIISPIHTWGATLDGLGLQVTFGLIVAVRQQPGDILKAFSRVVDIQMYIEQALYGSGRLLVGSMDSPEYAIPFRSFDANGDPTGIINQHGLRYERGLWTDATPDGELLQAWNTTITVSIY